MVIYELRLLRPLIQHPDAEIVLEVNRLNVRMYDPEAHVWKTSCETTLPESVIEKLLAANGPAGICEVIDRIENPSYLERELRYAILGFVRQEDFRGKRMLDFGCGSGASTVVLAKMLPETEIVGLDLVPRYAEAARAVAEHFELERVSFVEKPEGRFDFVTLNAVYEHLLPRERKQLMPWLWNLLEPEGTLFVNMCPHRWYPLEYHTTMLPLLNYLPDHLALRAARFAGLKRRGISRDARWKDLLRGGIRGATEAEISKLLPNGKTLEPLAYPDAVDLWYASSTERRPHPVKKAMRAGFKLITKLSGSSFTPHLTMAVRKGETSARTKVVREPEATSSTL